MFIGRKKELEFLNAKYKSNKGELVVLYGRRRVGKTELLREFCRNKKAIFFSCIECSDDKQLANFSKAILLEHKDMAKYISKFDSWERAFISLKKLEKENEEKLIVVIDEFPYMCDSNPSIPSILQNTWDSELQRSNVMIVLCGSSMSFMEKEILAEKNPLYGRATGVYRLMPLNFYEMKGFFPKYSPADLIKVYAILGGIPHYLMQFDNTKSLEWNIKNNILKKGCVLYDEVEFLMHQEFRETNVYNVILENIANGATKVGEISDKALLGNTAKTSVYLKNLLEVSLVEKVYSVEDNAKNKANQNKGLYRIADAYFRFWYAFVFSNFSELELGEVDSVYKYLIEPRLQDFCSYAFERVCQLYLQQLNLQEQLPTFYKGLSNWWGKAKVKQIANGRDTVKTVETELDILGISYDKKKILIGECEFMTRPMRYEEYIVTRNKAIEFESADVDYYLFSESGFEHKLHEESDDKVHLITLEDVVRKF